jgi:ankyrin repeat protein
MQRQVTDFHCGNKRKRKQPNLRYKKPESELGKRITSEWQKRLNVGFLKSAKEGKTKRVERLLKLGADLGAKDYFDIDSRALHLAAGNGHTETCALLIDRGADIDAMDSQGWTALMWAAHRGHTKVCRLLFECGASINKRGGGWTALMWAKDAGQREAAGFLAFVTVAPRIFADREASSSFYSGFRECIGS